MYINLSLSIVCLCVYYLIFFARVCYLSLSLCVSVGIALYLTVPRARFSLSLSLYIYISHPLLLSGLLSLGPKRPRRKTADRDKFFCLFLCCLCCVCLAKNLGKFLHFFLWDDDRERKFHTQKKKSCTLYSVSSLSLSSLKREPSSHARALQKRAHRCCCCCCCCC